MRVAVAAIARPTFDVEFAQEVADAALAALREAGHEPIGDSTLLMDEAAVREAAMGWDDAEELVVLQATFADSTLVATAARSTDARLRLWGFPEARTGGRLRLNSLCGINLAAYALTEAGRAYHHAYGPPDLDTAVELMSGSTVAAAPVPKKPSLSEMHRRAAADVAERLRHARIGVVGDHPDGFEPCSYRADWLEGIGPTVDRVELEDLFAAGNHATREEVDALTQRARRSLGSLDSLDQESLEQSIRLGCGLQATATERGWSAVATRCWPECFTDYGGAVCSPHAFLSDDGIPGMCEADTYGGLTALVLNWLTGGPSFVADLVELSGDTGVFWHCGNAPPSLAGSQPAPALHSNRHKPLLGEFVLKPGLMTVLRVSQSGGRQRLVIGRVEALEAPLPFGGTSAVVRFERPILPTVMAEGLEHHYGLAYGDVTSDLWALAEHLDLEVVAL